MQMTITYTRNVSMVKAVDAETYLAPNCEYEYNVLANTAEPEQLATETWTIDEGKDFLFAVGHMHSGAINISAYLNGVFSHGPFSH